MQRLTLIVGLPGSGKTHLAYELAHRGGGTVIDDISVDTDTKCGIDGEYLIVTDPNACAAPPASVMRKLQDWFGERTIEVIAFSPDIEACWKNIQHRADDRKISRATLVALAKNYKPEEWGEVHPVWCD